MGPAAASAAGAAAGGAGSLIEGIGSLLPTSTKGKSSSKAESETSASQLDRGTSSTLGSGTSASDTTSSNIRSNTGAETTSSSQKSTTTSQASEQFSGQENKTSSQTLIDTPGIMRIMNMALQDQNSGLQGLVSGERNAGLFNSSTNQMLLSDLLTRVSGEAARLGAKTVGTESLGATSTTQKAQSSTVLDAVTQALSSAKETTAGRESNRGATTSQEDAVTGFLSLAENLTKQTQDSTTKSKSSKCPFSIVAASLALSMMSDNDPKLEALRDFRDTTVTRINPDHIVSYYRTGPAFVVHLDSLSMDDSHKLKLAIDADYMERIIALHKAGNDQEAYAVYLQFLQLMETRTA